MKYIIGVVIVGFLCVAHAQEVPQEPAPTLETQTAPETSVPIEAQTQAAQDEAPLIPPAVVTNEPPFVVAGEKWLALDIDILSNRYQAQKFTYTYRSAILRRALSALGIDFETAEVVPGTPFYDNTQEVLFKNLARAFGAAYNEVVSDDAYDGHYAVASRIVLRGNHKINCVIVLTRREVDPNLVWIRQSECSPEWINGESIAGALTNDFTGFFYVENGAFELTPYLSVGPESFKSRRRPTP